MYTHTPLAFCCMSLEVVTDLGKKVSNYELQHDLLFVMSWNPFVFKPSRGETILNV